jgi:hypothetical protein
MYKIQYYLRRRIQLGLRSASSLGAFMLVSLVAVGLVGCGGSKEATDLSPEASDATLQNMPNWFSSPPEESDYLFGTGTSTSRSMQMAIDKASTTARGNLASTLESQFESLSKQFEEEVGSSSNSELLTQFTQAQREVVSQVLNGVSTRDRQILNEDGVYRAYVLVEMPIGQAAAELMRKLQQNDDMYTRFRSTQAFEELDEQVEEYEQFRQQQGARQ